LPYPGLAASKLASNPQSSLAKRASELCTSTTPLTKETYHVDDLRGSGDPAMACTSMVQRPVCRRHVCVPVFPGEKVLDDGRVGPCLRPWPGSSSSLDS
jgi:hypothetical protein